jgi:hypothetical protein
VLLLLRLLCPASCAGPSGPFPTHALALPTASQPLPSGPPPALPKRVSRRLAQLRLPPCGPPPTTPAPTTHAHPPAGMPVTSVRELRVLQGCRHPNLVDLKRVVTGALGCARLRPVPETARRRARVPAHTMSAGTSSGVFVRRVATLGACSSPHQTHRPTEPSTHTKKLALLSLQAPAWTLCSWCLSTARTTWGGWWMRCRSPSTSRK